MPLPVAHCDREVEALPLPEALVEGKCEGSTVVAVVGDGEGEALALGVSLALVQCVADGV